MNPSHWTKKDIRTLCGYLDSFYVCNRPLSVLQWRDAIPKIRAVLVANRKEIVLAGIRSARATSAERYAQNCETVGNQLARFTEYGHPNELITRFIGFAREEDKAGRRLESLLHRVLAEGLPSEVESYDPLPTPSIPLPSPTP